MMPDQRLMEPEALESASDPIPKTLYVLIAKNLIDARLTKQWHDYDVASPEGSR